MRLTQADRDVLYALDHRLGWTVNWLRRRVRGYGDSDPIRERAVLSYHLKRLWKHGLCEPVGNAKPGVWRITALGHEMIRDAFEGEKR